jgi:hypothetical protein
MNFRFPIWLLLLAIFTYFPIAYFNLNIYYALIPTIYLAFAFITLSISAIKRTFFNKNDSNNKEK